MTQSTVQLVLRDSMRNGWTAPCCCWHASIRLMHYLNFIIQNVPSSCAISISSFDASSENRRNLTLALHLSKRSNSASGLAWLAANACRTALRRTSNCPLRWARAARCRRRIPHLPPARVTLELTSSPHACVALLTVGLDILVPFLPATAACTSQLHSPSVNRR